MESLHKIVVSTVGRKRRYKGICPRCGEPYSYLERRSVGGKVYYYAVHYEGIKDGKRRYRKCYLGPDYYTYTSLLHEREGLVFKGLMDNDRLLVYLDIIINYLSRSGRLTPSLALELADRFEELARALREAAKHEK